MGSDWEGRVAMVTGANSGIGFHVADHFLSMGMVVIALDKNIDNIQRNNNRLHALEVDLTQEHQVTRAFLWAEENHGGVDVLINNAGVGGATSLLEGKPSEWRKLLDVNVIAFTQCAAEAIRSMRKRGIMHGQIINITSNLANFVPSYAPFHFYSATKHAAKALAEGFRQELRDIEVPIRVSCVSPGLVKTDIFRSSMGDQMDKMVYDKYPSISPEDIASAIEYILSTPQHVNIYEICIKPRGSQE